MRKAILLLDLAFLAIFIPVTAQATAADVPAIMSSLERAYPKFEALCAGDTHTRSGAVDEAMSSLGRTPQSKPNDLKRDVLRRLEERCGSAMKSK
jgi:outer membrane lipoprotein-sorting protein